MWNKNIYLYITRGSSDSFFFHKAVPLAGLVILWLLFLVHVDNVNRRIDMMLLRVLTLLLHAPILEPYLYLALGQMNALGDLNSPFSSQILAEAVLLFQFECLLPRIDLSMFTLIMRAFTLSHNKNFI